ncbi:hypothetical protein P7K49_028652 [Saguinus oedipus]|uniref:Uncharacterized protein n=1 Tax=Saguinus oedipus TaxID=9490 RepID=A0ABQ9U5Q4_SAGOE|nr:hypothetical protein P7K49_028652 [Saguinus oedipus]
MSSQGNKAPGERERGPHRQTQLLTPGVLVNIHQRQRSLRPTLLPKSPHQASSGTDDSALAWFLSLPDHLTVRPLHGREVPEASCTLDVVSAARGRRLQDVLEKGTRTKQMFTKHGGQKSAKGRVQPSLDYLAQLVPQFPHGSKSAETCGYPLPPAIAGDARIQRLLQGSMELALPYSVGASSHPLKPPVTDLHSSGQTEGNPLLSLLLLSSLQNE